jgi:hypothetical protein
MEHTARTEEVTNEIQTTINHQPGNNDALGNKLDQLDWLMYGYADSLQQFLND